MVLSAPWLFDGLGGVRREAAVVVDLATGRILAVGKAAEYPDARRVEGALAPGFINAHGHLELSHMRGQIPSGLGMVPFLDAVTFGRTAEPEAVAAAIDEAHRELQREGVVGMGDIANTTDALACKRRSPLRWHSFIEVFGAVPGTWRKGMERGLPVLEAHGAAGLSAVLNPHASYSVAAPMLAELQRLAGEAPNAAGQAAPLSIHLQESPEEDAWFREGTGPFAAFFGKLGLEVPPPGEGRSPAEAVLEGLQGSSTNAESARAAPPRLILVHNTMAQPEDIARAASRPNTWWCFCPRANRYITGRLPRLEHWFDRPEPLDGRMLIGTDSLASNARLSVHAELQELAAAYPDLPAAQLLRWACGNGAEAFGWSAELGAIEAGRSPGLLVLKPSPEAEGKGQGLENEAVPAAARWFGQGSSMEVLLPAGHR